MNKQRNQQETMPGQVLQSDIVRLGKTMRRARATLGKTTAFNSRFWSNLERLQRLQLDCLGKRMALLGWSYMNARKTPHAMSDDELCARGENLEEQMSALKQMGRVQGYHRRQLREGDAYGRLLLSWADSDAQEGDSSRDEAQAWYDDDAQAEQRARRSRRVDDMAERYCGVGSTVPYRWDPVLNTWLHASSASAVALFPEAEGDMTDRVFGAAAEVDGARNGLFLHWRIERALDRGWIAIVPDVDARPDLRGPIVGGPGYAVQDQKLAAWGRQPLKEYKIVLMSIAALDGQKLTFLTVFRPHPRFLWWRFLAGLSRVSWSDRVDRASLDRINMLEQVIRWGTKGGYMPDSVVRGFFPHVNRELLGMLDYAARHAGVVVEACEEPERGHDVEGDPVGVLVATKEAIRKLQVEDQELDVDVDDGDDDDDDDVQGRSDE
ncbi:uncharacterized protein UV8b_06099 [Ustilaginoidea virens]|uniref:HNH nuclease domain-containing protein n=1 Tax=Ustilaginoidea virens TaxID=1159556 RepID=A0A8E5MIS1_USTVR|nr:uncharacterized protein UV8b_06099 [Ustilaginoidea virens]QUC21858.1 hypothetical protein UV8b_06099 [Ustilaginoidea virens]